MSRTVKRNWLKKQIENGCVFGRCCHSHTEDYVNSIWKPVRIKHADFIDGFINLNETDFSTKTGMAWRTKMDPNLIEFSVHAGLHYQLKIQSKDNEDE